MWKIKVGTHRTTFNNFYIPIKTTKLPSERAAALINRIAAQVKNGAKVFWVCPLVEESETTDITRWDFSVMAAKTYVGNLRDNVKRSMKYNWEHSRNRFGLLR